MDKMERVTELPVGPNDQTQSVLEVRRYSYQISTQILVGFVLLLLQTVMNPRIEDIKFLRRRWLEVV